MNGRFVFICLLTFLFALPAGSAVAQPGDEQTVTDKAPPPVAQSLVREGDFAVKLVEKLNLGTVGSEAEAETALASIGIAPKNGWIADYPVTPDILSELRDAVKDAASSGRLAMSADQALLAFNKVAAESGLPVVADTGPADPAKSYNQYTDPTIINNYYYNEGPPVVTYYPPPWDYYYLYSWVPYPFWWHSFWFSGFFILHDFHLVVVVKKHGFKAISNHVFHRGHKKVVRVDHLGRTSSRSFRSGGGIDRVRGGSLSGSRTGAASIMRRSLERSGVSNSGPQGRNRGRSGISVSSSGPGNIRDRMAPDFRRDNSGSSVRGSGSSGRGSSRGGCRGRC